MRVSTARRAPHHGVVERGHLGRAREQRRKGEREVGRVGDDLAAVDHGAAGLARGRVDHGRTPGRVRS